MNVDACVLALVAVADLACIVQLRRRHARHVRIERMMASLRMAIRLANAPEALHARRPLRRAG